MALDFEQTKELEELKQKNKIDAMEAADENADAEHSRKMKRLDKLLEIAKAGGAGLGGDG